MIEYKEGSLWLSFRLYGQDFCMLSDDIESITMPNRIDPIPNTASTTAGVTSYAGSLIGVVEMRALFGVMNLKDYTAQFGIMREMHVSWVEDLERYVQEGGSFTKAVDPHKCKFGLWYDGFDTDNNRLKRLLKRINTPHERIHRCGADIVALRGLEGDHEAKIQAKLAEAKDICYKEIVPLLDRLIDIYRSINRGVLLIVRQEGVCVGMLVDEVKELIPCGKTTQQPYPEQMGQSRFVRQIVMSEHRVMLEIDIEPVMQVYNGDTATTV